VDVVVDTDEAGSVVSDVIDELGLKGKTRVVMAQFRKTHPHYGG